MGCECTGKEKFMHSLFSSVEAVVPHKYLICLSDFSDNYRCQLKALNQDKISNTENSLWFICH